MTPQEEIALAKRVREAAPGAIVEVSSEELGLLTDRPHYHQAYSQMGLHARWIENGEWTKPPRDSLFPPGARLEWVETYSIDMAAPMRTGFRAWCADRLRALADWIA